MNQAKGRFIHSRTMHRQIRDLLQALFVAEIISPSKCIWIVSPWITDIPIIDNLTNAFSTLEPQWGRTQVRLSQIIYKLLDMGTTVRIATRSSHSTENFISSINSRTSSWVDAPLDIQEVDELHEKGILGDDYYLAGSMNFTYNGITLNEESVHFHTDPQIVAENRVIFRDRWGSENW